MKYIDGLWSYLLILMIGLWFLMYMNESLADGGLMSTKPYISSSNYILKMSNYKKGDWCKTRDALFWNFMDKQRDFFLKILE